MTLKFKLDENLSRRLAEPLIKAGHDVSSVYEQRLTGGPDDNLLDICKREDRVLISGDGDFQNVRVFPPRRYAGIIVLQPHRPSYRETLLLVRKIVPHLRQYQDQVRGALWVVDHLRIREHIGFDD